MRHKRMIHCMFALLIAASSAQAQTGDWQAVSSTLVKAQRRYLCYVENATDNELVCKVHQPRSLRLSTLTIPRAQVREVHLLPNQAKDAWIGAGIGAGAGAAVAASTSRTSRGASAFFGALRSVPREASWHDGSALSVYFSARQNHL